MARRYSNWATVYGTTRSNRQLEYCQTLQLEVTDESSVRATIDRVISQEGRIDVLINNAGIVLSGPSESTSMEAVVRQFEVNCFGVMRVTHQVLPWMRQQRSGLILNIGSMAGSVPLPFRSHYAASKAAMENWAWALRLELKRLGIGVCCVQAGDFRSELSESGRLAFPDSILHAECRRAYEPTCDRIIAKFIAEELKGIEPAEIAAHLESIVRRHTRPHRFRHTVGPLNQRLLFSIRGFLPDRLLEAIIARLYDSTSNQ